MLQTRFLVLGEPIGLVKRDRVGFLEEAALELNSKDECVRVYVCALWVCVHVHTCMYLCVHTYACVRVLLSHLVLIPVNLTV